MKRLVIATLLACSFILGSLTIAFAKPITPTPISVATQCVFEAGVTQNCQSTNPDIVLNLHNTGDTSQCRFAIQVDWGDGSMVQNFTISGGPNGSEYLSNHVYPTSPRAFQITATGSVLSGPCTFSGATYQFTLLSGCTPQITSVSSFAAQQTQSVTIQGSCFGTGNTVSSSDTPSFKITINPSTFSEWHACYTGDAPADSVTCDISAWTDTSITFSGFTGQYGQNGWIVNPRDLLTIQVWNPQTNQGPGACTVVAGTPGITLCANPCGTTSCTNLWGVDSGDSLIPTKYTGYNAYNLVTKNYGVPDFWGRYIGADPLHNDPHQHTLYKKDLFQKEVTFAHSVGLAILPIYFNFSASKVTTRTQGQNYAKWAIEDALGRLGIAQGVAIFVDIESNVSPTVAFIQGWYDQFGKTFTFTNGKQSLRYNAGYYHAGYYASSNKASNTTFDKVYCAAVKSEPQIGTNSFIYAIHPSLGLSSAVSAPPYSPYKPNCASQNAGWQYGIQRNSKARPNVDTDEAQLSLPLWHP